MRKIVLFLILIMLASHCSKKNEKLNPMIGQELLLVEQEMSKKNYDRVVNFIDEYFRKNEITLTNAKLLVNKAEALKKIVNNGNKTSYKKRKQIAKKYGLKLRNGWLYYDYKEYKDIWESIPSTDLGKKAFDIWLSHLNTNDDKIIYLEKYLDKVKDRTDLKLQLVNLYIDKISFKKDKYVKKCLSLLDNISKTAHNAREKSIARLNKIILQYFSDKNIEKFKENLESYNGKLYIHKSLKYYLLSEILFIKGKLTESLSHLKKAMKFLKRSKDDDEIPKILIKMVKLPENDKDALEYEIKKKSNLIQGIIDYREQIKKERLGYIIGDRVRVRKRPVIKRNNIITSLNTGDKVIVIRTSDKLESLKGRKDYWYQVKLKDGTIGWVFGKYITMFIR